MPAENKTFIEISLVDRFHGPSAQGILRNILLNYGVKPGAIAESSNGLDFTVSTYAASKKQANVLKARLLRLKLKKVLVRSKVLRKKDWQDKWKKDFRTFPLTPSIDVVPAWQKRRYRLKKRQPIFIETSSAFGTGMHETTKFMAQLIEGLRGEFETFLDIGTGTGILSLVALKNGAKKIFAFDADKESVKTAQTNFLLNKYPSSCIKSGDITKLRGKKEFDCVAANLITYHLIEAGCNILSFVRPGKFLAVSGISLENLTLLKKAYQKLPLRCLEVKKGKEWAALLYQRILK